jgi:hypothetical protein
VYNILCDSVGMIPRPNNGTLRLPLKPLGLHRPEDTPTELADPATSIPVESTSLSATKTIGVDTVEVHPQSKTVSQSPGPTSYDKETTEEQDDEDIAKQEQGILGFWDWLKGKVGNLWDKVAGSGSGSDSRSR